MQVYSRTYTHTFDRYVLNGLTHYRQCQRIPHSYDGSTIKPHDPRSLAVFRELA